MSVSKNKVKVKKTLHTKGREIFPSLDHTPRIVHCGARKKPF